MFNMKTICLYFRKKGTWHITQPKVPVSAIIKVMDNMKKYRIYDFDIDIDGIEMRRSEWEEKFDYLRNTNNVDIDTKFVINNYMKSEKKEVNGIYTIHCNGRFNSMCTITISVHMTIQGTSSLYNSLMFRSIHTYVVGLLHTMNFNNYATVKQLVPVEYEEFKDISEYRYSGVSKYK